MIVSRGLALGRLTGDIAKNLVLGSRINVLTKSSIRCHGKEYGYRYRYYPDLSEWKPYPLGVLAGALTWWWVLWHLFTDYHELTGHSFPDPSKWTDEELGIPPEDAD